jgi:hypothetical protein
MLVHTIGLAREWFNLTFGRVDCRVTAHRSLNRQATQRLKHGNLNIQYVLYLQGMFSCKGEYQGADITLPVSFSL